MSVPSIEKLPALEPHTVVGVRAGDLLDCLASAADAVAAAQAQLAEARAWLPREAFDDQPAVI